MAYIYQNSTWAAYDTKKYVVNTNTFTTYPFTIKSPITPISTTIYGNMVQSGTPTPTTPIQPQECGDLETEGEHTGQYKIPILNNSQTTNVYLGEVETERKIRKIVFDGTEDWQTYGSVSNTYRLSISNIQSIGNPAICSHFVNSPISSITSGKFTVGSTWIYICYADVADATDFKAYLAQQYANGTPVCVWYVLATPTTGIVNEPLRKIGDYADTVATSIPVTINSDSVDINTTLKPSAVAAPSLSWGTGDDYKRSGGAWG